MPAWNFIKKRLRSRSFGETPPLVVSWACQQIFGQHLSYFIILLLSSSTYPTQWKRLKVNAPYKAGASSDANNYGPISVFPAIWKIIEKAIYRPLMSHLEKNNLIDKYHFGFRFKISNKLGEVGEILMGEK